MDTILLDIAKDGIATLKLNRPEKRNALNTQLLDELNLALNEIANNQEIRALQITGEGKAFCAGGDVNSMIARLGKAYTTKERLESKIHSIVRMLHGMKVPVLATVNGACFGAGLVIATACDVIIAAESAKFGFVYGNIGLVSEASYHLVKLMGIQRAKYLVFGRKVISAEEAMRNGLVLEISPDQELQNRANEILDEWASGPKSSISLSKQLLNAALDNSIDYQLQMEAAYQGVAFTTPEHKEGVDAFLEKRKPNFKSL